MKILDRPVDKVRVGTHARKKKRKKETSEKPETRRGWELLGGEGKVGQDQRDSDEQRVSAASH